VVPQAPDVPKIEYPAKISDPIELPISIIPDPKAGDLVTIDI
jgi:hypothetical protein